jgi:hypothetical protein
MTCTLLISMEPLKYLWPPSIDTGILLVNKSISNRRSIQRYIQKSDWFRAWAQINAPTGVATGAVK